MNRRSILNESQIESLVAKAADEFCEDARLGKNPSVEHYAKRYPEIAHIIRDVFVGLTNLNQSSPSESKSANLTNHQLGDFQIQDELGRGGMGIVYSATQLSIGRQVALKVLPFAATLDDMQLARFKHEVRAVGMLNHPHIVPVYSVGQERGVHYYAMQLIEGQSMADLIGNLKSDRSESLGLPIADLAMADVAKKGTHALVSRSHEDTTARPDTVRNSNRSTVPHLKSIGLANRYQAIARLGYEAAIALQHAHQAGVIHRDIKPANLMIDKSGKLWVTDFGLARTEDGRSMTMPGELIGTMRYMSPEQIDGDSSLIGQRSDVYSLGVSLYEMLTLQPAILGESRQELLRAVVESKPITPRKIDPAIPKSLELVIQKAIEKNADDRYATAQAFAEDLSRVLEDKPILAKRTSFVDRTRKWVRRHPAAIASMLGVLTVLAIGLTTSLALIFTAQKNTERAFESEQRQRQRADDNLRSAREFIHEMYLSESDRVGLIAELSDDQRNFFEEVVRFYESLPKSETGSPELRRETAQAHGRLAAAKRKLGEHDVAVTHLQKAEAIFSNLVDAFPIDSAFQFERAVIRVELAEACGHLRRTLDSRSANRRALEDLNKIESVNSIQPWQLDLYRSLAEKSLAGAENDLGNTDAAQGLYQSSTQRLARLRDQFPEEMEIQFHVASVGQMYGSFLHNAKGDSNAMSAYREAVEEAEDLLSKQPANLRIQTLVARLYNDAAILSRDVGQFSRAKEFYLRSVKLWEAASDQYPGRPGFRRLRATTLANLGELAHNQRDHETAIDAFREAEGVLLKLATRFPASPEFGPELARARSNLGNSVFRLGRTTRSPELIEESKRIREQLITQWESLVERFPNQTGFRAELAMAHYAMADSVDNAEAACRHCIKAIDLLKPLAEEFPDTRNYTERLTSCLNVLGSKLKGQGKFQEAEKALQEAIDIADGLHERWSTVPDYVGKLARRHRHLGILYLETKEYAKAVAEFEKSLAYREKLSNEFPEYRRSMYANPIASLHALLGAAILRNDPSDKASSDEHFEKAVRMSIDADSFKDLYSYLRALNTSEIQALLLLHARLSSAKTE